MHPDERVVTRVPLMTRLGLLLVLVIGVIALGAIPPIVTGDTSGLIKVGATVICLAIGLLSVFAAVWAWRFKTVFTRDVITVHGLLFTNKITRETATRISIGSANIHTGRSQLPFSRLTIEGRDQYGARAIAALDPFWPHAEAAFGIVRDWAQARPDIVAPEAAEAFGLR